MRASTRRSFVIGAGSVAAAAVLPVGREASGNTESAINEVDDQVRARIDQQRSDIIAAMKRENIPGAAVCFVHEGKPVWMEGFGVTDRASQRRVDVDTIFSIQSTSKNMTATAIMSAVQRGWLDLDKPVTTPTARLSTSGRQWRRGEISRL